MSIRTKILIPLLGFIALGALLAVFIAFTSVASESRLAAISNHATSAADDSRAAGEQFDKVEQLTSQVMAMTDFLDSDKIETRFKTASDAAADRLARLKAEALSQKMAQLAQTTIDEFAQWRSDAEAVVGLRPASEIVTADTLAKRGDSIRGHLARAVALAGQDARDGIADAEAGMRDELWIVLAVAALVAAAGAAGAFWLARNLADPLKTLAVGATKLAAGDVSVAFSALDRKDEVGEIARSIETFRSNVKAQIRSQAEADEQRRLSSQDRARNEEARAAASASQDAAMGALASGLAQLAKGDLTHAIGGIPQAYAQLEHDFNVALTQLSQVMQSIAASSNKIEHDSHEVSAAADDLSGRTEQQAASLEETSATLDSVMATVRKTAAGATHATTIVSKAKSEAESSGEVVRRAIDAMGTIEKSSGQIGQIVGVIDEIAFQTNLLALNAGVEAARAGDAGKGFAVVASEVRALAQRSAEAAKEIKTLISTSATQVTSGVHLVDQTSQALLRILEQVADINGVVKDIAASAAAQVNGLEEVNIALNQIGKITQQNAAQAEESTAASHQLAEEARLLSTLVARFTIERMRNAEKATRAARAA